MNVLGHGKDFLSHYWHGMCLMHFYRAFPRVCHKSIIIQDQRSFAVVVLYALFLVYFPLELEG